jgi:hypothetical protein
MERKASFVQAVQAASTTLMRHIQRLETLARI